MEQPVVKDLHRIPCGAIRSLCRLCRLERTTNTVVAPGRKRQAKAFHKEFHLRDSLFPRSHRVVHQQDQEILLVALEATEVDLEEMGMAAVAMVLADQGYVHCVEYIHVFAVESVDGFHVSADWLQACNRQMEERGQERHVRIVDN